MTAWNRIDRGGGRPLVLLHGGGASCRSWLPVINLLAAHRRVIALDFPGFGRTPAPVDAPFTMDWAMQQLAAELVRLGIRGPVDMAGNSMGGWMALEAAKRGMARSVVALGPAGLWATGMPRSTQALFGIGLRLAWISQTSARHVLRVPSVRAAALRVLVKHPHRMTTGDAIGLLADLHTSSPALRKALALNVHNRFEGGQHITVRVTVAIGSHDRMVPARTSRFRDQLPAHTRWVTLPDCGHLPMWDHPDLVVRTILEGTAKNTVSAAPRA